MTGRAGFGRRDVVLAALGLAMLPMRRAWADAVPAGLRVGAVAVDTGPVRARGLSASVADAIGVDLSLALRQQFADRIVADRKAPTLVARIDSFSMASYSGTDVGAFKGPSATDYLEGAGLVTSGGRVLSTTPMLSALAANYSGVWYLPDIDARRIQSISEHFAFWLRREMGL